jgi:hypothetical protein
VRLILITDFTFIQGFPVTVLASKPFKLIRIFCSFADVLHQTSRMSLDYALTASLLVLSLSSSINLNIRRYIISTNANDLR